MVKKRQYFSGLERCLDKTGGGVSLYFGNAGGISPKGTGDALPGVELASGLNLADVSPDDVVGLLDWRCHRNQREGESEGGD